MERKGGKKESLYTHKIAQVRLEAKGSGNSVDSSNIASGRRMRYLPGRWNPSPRTTVAAVSFLDLRQKTNNRLAQIPILIGGSLVRYSLCGLICWRFGRSGGGYGQRHTICIHSCLIILTALELQHTFAEELEQVNAVYLEGKGLLENLCFLDGLRELKLREKYKSKPSKVLK